MLTVTYSLNGQTKVNDFTSQESFNTFCEQVNPTDNPYTLEVIKTEYNKDVEIPYYHNLIIQDRIKGKDTQLRHYKAIEKGSFRIVYYGFTSLSKAGYLIQNYFYFVDTIKNSEFGKSYNFLSVIDSNVIDGHIEPSSDDLVKRLNSFVGGLKTAIKQKPEYIS